MLPSTRKMAERLHVSRKTVITAMEILQARGKLVSKDRVGMFVAQGPVKERPEPNCRLVVNDGFPDTRLLPFREFSRSYRKLFNRAALWHNLGYNNPAGYPKLLDHIAGNLRHSCELPVGDDEVCILSGGRDCRCTRYRWMRTGWTPGRWRGFAGRSA